MIDCIYTECKQFHSKWNHVGHPKTLADLLNQNYLIGQVLWNKERKIITSNTQLFFRAALWPCCWSQFPWLFQSIPPRAIKLHLGSSLPAITPQMPPTWERRMSKETIFKISITIPWTFSHFTLAPDWLLQLVGVIFEIPSKNLVADVTARKHFKKSFFSSSFAVPLLGSDNLLLYKVCEYLFIGIFLALQHDV